jgi:predicted GH43/DUF377 family glycosyl hydrolase
MVRLLSTIVPHRARPVTLVACVFVAVMSGRSSRADARATDSQPAPKGVTLYVSRLGDNTDGRTWARAFTTIQRALDAVPDANGGHRIIVRPDTYVEANLYPAFKGAAGAYNVLTGDCDGRLGSGATGWVVIDSSCPEKVVRTDPKGKGGNPGFIVFDSGGPEKGLKSIDWWGPWRCDPSFSGVIWDRWIFRHLYATGSEGGIGWDMTCQAGAEFSAIVEDCVGIGRFAGACVMGHVGRADEPVVFRRSYFGCLDWWGDAGAAYVRAHHMAMPHYPDAVFEDCTLVSPDNALECGYPGFPGYTRVKFKDCRMIVMNFSQPAGTPSGGIIHTPLDGRQLHVDLDDCTLMGYKVFGAGKGEIGYTTAGAVRAYVQFRQPTPKGFERLGLWPKEVFQYIAPPERPRPRPALTKGGLIRRDMCEAAPFVWEGRLCLMEAVRPASGGEPRDYYIRLTDIETNKTVARLGEGYGLPCILVHDETAYVFASRHESENWNDVTLFLSRDLKQWEQTVVIRQETEHLFNSSVCATDDGFVMAYESDDPTYVPFTVKFARSKDLRTWTKLPDVFGADRYTACPCIRYAGGCYYLMYAEHLKPQWFFETWLARSKDLKTWQMSPANPVLTPDAGDEGICTSDPDVLEFGGRTYLYYAVGDQHTWMDVRRAIYPGTLRGFFEDRFRP